MWLIVAETNLAIGSILLFSFLSIIYLYFQAYYFSSFEKIIGVEMNAELCHIQNEIVNKYGLGNRIKVRT